MTLLIYDGLTDILTQYGNIAQYDLVAGSLHILLFSTILSEHKIISLGTDANITKYNL